MKKIMLVAAAVAACVALAGEREDGLYISHVHRGGGKFEAPDNTLETFLWCWGNGSALECDCRVTKDGVGIMFHDNNLKRTPRGIPDDWKARKVYDAMSPFNFADKLSGHVLFVHGTMDENTGTHPIQSERMYQAAAGAGKDVDYLQLPYEGHGYIYKENMLHLFSELYNMLETYVKNAEPADEKPVEKPKAQ